MHHASVATLWPLSCDNFYRRRKADAAARCDECDSRWLDDEFRLLLFVARAIITSISSRPTSSSQVVVSHALHPSCFDVRRTSLVYTWGRVVWDELSRLTVVNFWPAAVVIKHPAQLFNVPLIPNKLPHIYEVWAGYMERKFAFEEVTR